MDKTREMVMGYWAGKNDSCLEYPEIYKNTSSAFKPGGLNGRDDRIGVPREKASVLRARAELILNNVGIGECGNEGNL